MTETKGVMPASNGWKSEPDSVLFEAGSWNSPIIALC